MPYYPYICRTCENRFEVIKSLVQIDNEELSPCCNSLSDRTIGISSFINSGDWKPSFNPAFGQVVRSKSHQREILAKYRDQGKEFVEVGNEPVEKIHKHFDEKRAAKRIERWNESSEKILSEALN